MSVYPFFLAFPGLDKVPFVARELDALRKALLHVLTQQPRALVEISIQGVARLSTIPSLVKTIVRMQKTRALKGPGLQNIGNVLISHISFVFVREMRSNFGRNFVD